MRQLILAVGLLFFLLPLCAQNEGRILTLDTLWDVVARNHPLARQAALLPDFGRLELQRARGNFDPNISSAYNRKEFQDEPYFSFFQNEIKIPVWIGEVKAGYDFAYGNRVNPDEFIKDNGIGSVSIALPIIKNWVTDPRRTELNKAKVMVNMSEEERRLLLNNLFLESGLAWYQWCAAYEQLLVLERSVLLGEQRLNLVRTAVEFGDRPAIDTAEAWMILQDRMYWREQAALEWRNSMLELGNFLWDDEGKPLYPAPDTRPPDRNQWQLTDGTDISDSLNNPELNMYRMKIRMLDFDRLLKRESLRPDLKVETGYLWQPGPGNGRSVEQNYKVGLSLQMPLLFLRPAAEYKQAKIKVRQAQLEWELKRQYTENKVRAVRNEVNTVQQQIALINAQQVNVRQLWEGEETRLRNGESSLFLVNARETKMLEVELKQLLLYQKVQGNRLKLRNVLGALSP